MVATRPSPSRSGPGLHRIPAGDHATQVIDLHFIVAFEIARTGWVGELKGPVRTMACRLEMSSRKVEAQRGPPPRMKLE